MLDKKKSLADEFVKESAFGIRFAITQLANFCQDAPTISSSLENELTAISTVSGLAEKHINALHEIDRLEKQLHDETVAHTKLRDECHPQGG